jgi:hypothetical protein
MYGSLDNILTFRVKASDGGEWSASSLTRFTPAEIPPYLLDVRMDGTMSLYRRG